MDKQARKNRAHAAIKDMRGRIATFEVRQFLDLLDDLYEVAKDDLVSASPQDLIGRQAEAKVYRKLIKDLRQDHNPQE